MKQRKLEKERQAEEERQLKLMQEIGHSDLDATTLPLESAHNMEGLCMAEEMLLAEISAIPPTESYSVDVTSALQGALIPLENLDHNPPDNRERATTSRERATASRPPLPRRFDQQRMEQAPVPQAPAQLVRKVSSESQESAVSRQPPSSEESRQIQHLHESSQVATDSGNDQLAQTPPSDLILAEQEFLTPLERRALREKQRAAEQQALAVMPTAPQVTQQPKMQGALASPEPLTDGNYSSFENRTRSASSSAMDRLKQRMDRRQVDLVSRHEEEKVAKVAAGEGWKERIEERERQTEAEKLQAAELKRLSAERSEKRNAAMQRMLERREQRAAEIDSLEE